MSAAVDPKFGVGRVTRFYVPLLLQAFSQSLTYPLVAGIVTHGPDGVDARTAFSQGQVVMFMMGLYWKLSSESGNNVNPTPQNELTAWNIEQKTRS